MGTSTARIVDELYGLPMRALSNESGKETPRSQEQAKTSLRNQALAFGLDPNKILSEDPKVSGPERQKLVQGLINVTSNTIEKSPDIQNSKKGFDQAVKDFEANNNSVVIAAGNEGQHLERLSKTIGDRELKLPSDFTKNILENEDVTSVGAHPLVQQRRDS